MTRKWFLLAALFVALALPLLDWGGTGSPAPGIGMAVMAQGPPATAPIPAMAWQSQDESILAFTGIAWHRPVGPGSGGAVFVAIPDTKRLPVPDHGPYFLFAFDKTWKPMMYAGASGGVGFSHSARPVAGLLPDAKTLRWVV